MPRRDPRPRQSATEPSSTHCGRHDCSTAERAMEKTVAQAEARAVALQSGDIGHDCFCLVLSLARTLRGAALGHLKAKPQLEPGEIQAGSAVGVVDLKR